MERLDDLVQARTSIVLSLITIKSNQTKFANKYSAKVNKIGDI
jgi:hypothetical protein